MFRFSNGDKKELEPEPEELTSHLGIKRIRTMAKKMEERARESHPQYFQGDVSKIARTAAGTVR